MNVEQIKPKSNSLEDLQAYIAECSSVVRDKDPKSPEKLWDRLLTESFGNTASRVFEYVPCTVEIIEIPPVETESAEQEPHQYFGWFKRENYYTTMRELLNWGWTVEECIEAVDFIHYQTFKCEAPYFIYGQVSTHNQITSVSHSQRYGTCDRGYWMPPEVGEYFERTYIFPSPTSEIQTPQDLWNYKVENTSPADLKAFMKVCGIKRKEVWDRGADMLQNRVFTLGGYTNNPNAWPHFIDQRLDFHTQLETRQFTALIQEKIKE